MNHNKENNRQRERGKNQVRRHPTAMHKQCIQIRGLTFICGPSKKEFNKEKLCRRCKQRAF